MLAKSVHEVLPDEKAYNHMVGIINNFQDSKVHRSVLIWPQFVP